MPSTPTEVFPSTSVSRVYIHVPDKSGGAVYLIGSLQLNNTAFVANTAGEEGPAVNSVPVLSLMEFSNVSFENNVYHCPLGQYADTQSKEVSERSWSCSGKWPYSLNTVPNTTSAEFYPQ